jgi:hypothetical protein
VAAMGRKIPRSISVDGRGASEYNDDNDNDNDDDNDDDDDDDDDDDQMLDVLERSIFA